MTAQSKLQGSSPLLMRILHAARMVAGTDAPVMITGERGTGKEMLAREVHEVSPRRNQEFVTINCAGMSDEQLNRYLFDVQESSELSACNASGGTLFLDEVGELSRESQGKLFHFLETRQNEVLNLRLIASSTDLQQRVEAGQFREDLFFRLHIVPLDMPALRDRPEDIILLVKQFTAELARQHGRRIPKYSVTARNLLKAYLWPGNVRELRNFCERMVILMAGSTIQPENLPQEIRQGGDGNRGERSLFVLPAGGVDLFSLEGDVIRQALTMSGGNRSKAARLLNISRDTLLYRLRKHAIN